MREDKAEREKLLKGGGAAGGVEQAKRRKSANHRAQALHSTDEAENILRRMLRESGFDMSAPEAGLAWETFKEMCRSVRFSCADDGLLFETGIYDFTGEDKFCLSLVRQFTIEVDGEYDYMEQLHLDFYYPAAKELEELKTVIWTFDFDDDFERFFEAVEQSPSFRIPRGTMAPEQADLYLEEV